MGEKKSGFGMKIPDYISESLETIFRVKNVNSLMADGDPGSFRPWIQDRNVRIWDQE
jgi:hypothetical protein